MVEQEDGSTLVKNLLLGYQFTLPSKWKVNPPGGYPTAYYYQEFNVMVSLFFSDMVLDGSFKDSYTEVVKTASTNQNKIIAQAMTTNGHGTLLAYIRYKDYVTASIHGPVYGETYIIIFPVDDRIVVINASIGQRYRALLSFNSADIQAIRAIQDSIIIDK